MKQERTCDRWITEIHSNLHLVIRSPCLPNKALRWYRADRCRQPPSHPLRGPGSESDACGTRAFQAHDSQSSNLQLLQLGCNHRLLISFKDFLLLSIDRDVKLDGAIGAAEFFGEIKLPLRGWRLLRQIGKLETSHRRRCRRYRFCFGRVRAFITVRHLDISENRSDIRVSRRARGIGLSKQYGAAAFLRSLHNKFGPPGRRNQDRLFFPGLGQAGSRQAR